VHGGAIFRLVSARAGHTGHTGEPA
jgi:hypothetical protein